jgi:hypothetical protein
MVVRGTPAIKRPMRLEIAITREIEHFRNMKRTKEVKI